MFAIEPDQRIIPPTGKAALAAASANAVVANCVVFVPATAVGAVGVPVKEGLLLSDFDATADAIAENSTSISVPLTIRAESPEGRLSLAVKLVDLI
jgi:hypothetical protein